MNSKVSPVYICVKINTSFLESLLKNIVQLNPFPNSENYGKSPFLNSEYILLFKQYVELQDLEAIIALLIAIWLYSKVNCTDKTTTFYPCLKDLILEEVWQPDLRVTSNMYVYIYMYVCI